MRSEGNELIARLLAILTFLSKVVIIIIIIIVIIIIIIIIIIVIIITIIIIMEVHQHLKVRYKIKTRGSRRGPVTSPASKFTKKSCNKLRKSI